MSASNGSIPPNAVVAGKEKSGETLYVARVSDANVTHIGKCGQHIRGAIVGRDGREQFFNSYEVLCGQSAQLKWVEQSCALDVSKLGGMPFMAGTDANGAALFVSRAKVAAPVNGHGGACSVGVQPGSISALMKGARVAYNGAEYIGNKYEVLVVVLGSIYWASSSGGNIPSNAIATGREADSRGELYTARAPFRGDACTTTQVGKAAKHLGGGSFAFGNKEVFVTDVEVLVGDPNAVKWVAYNGQLNLESLDGNPVGAGTDTDGSLLYPARVTLGRGIQPGKVSTSFTDGMHYGSDGKEKTSASYEVLCYN